MSGRIGVGDRRGSAGVFHSVVIDRCLWSRHEQAAQYLLSALFSAKQAGQVFHRLSGPLRDAESPSPFG
jgi:hypothetical protein